MASANEVILCADFVAYDDGRGGWCVYAQPSRGEYRVLAGPFETAEEAHCEAEKIGRE